MADSLLYPSHIAWQVSFAGMDSTEQIWGREVNKRVRRAREKLLSAGLGYRFEILPVTEAWLRLFLPVYEAHILAKKHGVVFDVHGNMAVGIAAGKLYEAVVLWQGEKLMGAMIYSIRGQEMHVAERAFPKQVEVKLPISCSYVAEEWLYKRALELGKNIIWHGRDRNPYGLNSAIGLAEYKLLIGCSPVVSRSQVVSMHRLADLRLDGEALVFLGEKKETPITEAILYTDLSLTEARKKYGVLWAQDKVAVRVEKIKTLAFG